MNGNGMAGDPTWRQVPVILKRLDAYPRGKLEGVVTALVHNCVAYIPGVQTTIAELLGLDPAAELLWRRGGRGEADVAACTKDSLAALASIETKGAKTGVSYGSHCPQECGTWRSQFEHMAHDNKPLLVIAPQRNLKAREEKWRAVNGLPANAVVMDYSRIAGLVAKSLDRDGLPEHSLLESLYDVEEVKSDDEGSGLL